MHQAHHYSVQEIPQGTIIAHFYADVMKESEYVDEQKVSDLPADAAVHHPDPHVDKLMTPLKIPHTESVLGTWYRFNHSKDPNVEPRLGEEDGFAIVKFITNRRIAVGEELLIKYDNAAVTNCYATLFLAV